MRCRVFSLLALWVVSWLTPRDGQGDIIVYWPEEPIVRLINSGWTYELDMDFNSVVDIVFHSDWTTYRLSNTGNSAILALPSTPPDEGSFIIPLSYGDYIGPDLETPAEWYDEESGGLFVSCMAVGPDEVLCIGLWPPEGLIGYFGLQFYIDDNVHYGWIMMDFTDFGTAGGNIVGWAYESNPDTPIMAGVIPEPGTLLLVLLGMVFIIWRFRYSRLDLAA